MTGYDEQTADRARELRREQIPAEAKLWSLVRASRMGRKFRRQQPIGPFIADFFCAEAKLKIEVDGGSHFERAEYDARRTSWLKTQGYTVLRLSNADVHTRPDDVRRAIGNMLDSLLAPPPLPGRQAATGPSPSRGEGSL